MLTEVASFDFIPWPEVCRLSKTDQEFAQELQDADANAAGSASEPKPWFAENVDDYETSYVYVEHIAEPLNETEFISRMGKKTILANTKQTPTAMLPRADGAPGMEKTGSANQTSVRPGSCTLFVQLGRIAASTCSTHLHTTFEVKALERTSILQA